MTVPIVRGIIHGRTIELTDDPAMPDGTVVEVTVRQVGHSVGLSLTELPGFGAWADQPECEQLDEWYRAERRHGLVDGEND